MLPGIRSREMKLKGQNVQIQKGLKEAQAPSLQMGADSRGAQHLQPPLLFLGVGGTAWK